MVFEAGDMLIVRSVEKHLPRDRKMVPAITSYNRFVDAVFDYAFQEWTFEKRYSPN